MNWAQVAAGAFTGLIVGLTGVGGGALMTPLLLLLFGVAPITAVGTDLWFAALTKTVAAPIHQGRGLIDWQIVRRLWAGSLPSSLLVTLLLRLHFIGTQNAHLLKTAIAAAVLMTVLGLIFQKALLRLGTRFGIGVEDEAHRAQALLTVAAGALLGALVTLTSVGAGALGVVFLVFLYPERLTPSRLVGTDIVHAIPLAVFAGMGHLFIGNVDFKLLALLLCGSIPGVVLGAKLSTRLPQFLLRWALAGALLVVGLRLWTSA